MDTGKFTENSVLKRPKGLWGVWQPCQRIEPKTQLEFKNPVIREYTLREEQEKCDLPISNQV